jgi:hypothetical protein
MAGRSETLVGAQREDDRAAGTGIEPGDDKTLARWRAQQRMAAVEMR